MRFFVSLFFGVVVGAVVWLLAPEPNRAPRSWVESTAIGAAGAMVGGVFGGALGWNGDTDPRGYFVALVGAAAWVAIYRVVRWRNNTAW